MPSAPTDRVVWQSGAVRRNVLAFAFLLLLPFYASLGPMLFQRASRGLVGDTVALAVLALAFSALMLLLLQQLVHAVRTHIAVDRTGVALTVPDGGTRGPLFLFRYKTAAFPYADVAAVETRREVYGGSLAPVVLQSTRVTLKSGEQVVLGYTNANDADDQVPAGEIGAHIAAAAGIEVVDHGLVHRSLQKRVLGVTRAAGAEAPVTADEVAALNAAHTRNLRAVVALLVLLVAGGIALDFASASRTTYAEMGAGLSNPAKGAPPAPPKKK